METATGKFGLELRNKRRNRGRMGNFKKEQNHEYLVSKENMEEMDVNKPKRCNEDQHLLHPNCSDRHRHRCNGHQVSRVNIGSDHIQKQTLNDRPHPRHKPTEREVQRI